MTNDLIHRSSLDGMKLFIAPGEKPDKETIGWNRAIDYVMNQAPAVDAEPVRHGRWISEVISKHDWKGRMRDYYQACSCPFCHEPDPGHGVSNYCPNCGAKMDARVEA